MIGTLIRWRLMIAWAIVAGSLCWVWPPEPRLILTNLHNVDIVGVTPDGRDLVALTRRAAPTEGIKLRSSNQAAEYIEIVSGPVQIWSLQTGERNEICIPGQSCSGPLVNCGGVQLMAAPDCWQVSKLSKPLQGRFLEFFTYNLKNLEQRELNLLNLDDGRVLKTNRRVSNENEISSALSPGLRWQLERGVLVNGDQEQWRLIDIATGQAHFTQLVDATILEHGFSDDDQYLALSIDGPLETGTQVWQVDPPKLHFQYTVPLRRLVISPDRTHLAGIHPTTSQLHVVELATGTVKQPAGGPLFGLEFTRPAFTPDSNRLLCYVPSYERGITEIGDFDLNSGKFESLTNPPPGQLSFSYRALPDSDNLLRRQRVTPRYVWRDQDLIDVVTKGTVYSLPKTKRGDTEVQSLTLSADNRTLVLKRRHFSATARALQVINRCGLTIPAQFWPPESIDLIIVDLATGQTRGILPNQLEDCWLSDDAKTLLTISAVDQKSLQVWDIPAGHVIAKPLLWSLVVPAIELLWLWRNRRRNRMRAGG